MKAGRRIGPVDLPGMACIDIRAEADRLWVNIGRGATPSFRMFAIRGEGMKPDQTSFVGGKQAVFEIKRLAINLNQIEGTPGHSRHSACCVLRLIRVNQIKPKTL